MRYKNFAEELERLRKENRLSVLEMAQALNMSYTGLRKILDGKTKSVQEGTIRNIALTFRCTVIEKDGNIYFEDTASRLATFVNEPAKASIPEKYLPKKDVDQIKEPDVEYLYGELADLFYKIAKLPEYQQTKLIETIKLQLDLINLK